MTEDEWKEMEQKAASWIEWKLSWKALRAGWKKHDDGTWRRMVRPDEPKVKNRVDWIVATAAEALEIDAAIPAPPRVP